jgi:hypothetical protein
MCRKSRSEVSPQVRPKITTQSYSNFGLSGGCDILGTVVIPGGGYGSWPELAGRVEQGAAQVLEQAQAVAGHGQAAA